MTDCTHQSINNAMCTMNWSLKIECVTRHIIIRRVAHSFALTENRPPPFLLVLGHIIVTAVGGLRRALRYSMQWVCTEWCLHISILDMHMLLASFEHIQHIQYINKPITPTCNVWGACWQFHSEDSNQSDWLVRIVCWICLAHWNVCWVSCTMHTHIYIYTWNAVAIWYDLEDGCRDFRWYIHTNTLTVALICTEVPQCMHYAPREKSDFVKRAVSTNCFIPPSACLIATSTYSLHIHQYIPVLLCVCACERR